MLLLVSVNHVVLLAFHAVSQSYSTARLRWHRTVATGNCPMPLAYKSQGKLQRPLVAGWAEVAANLVTGSEQHDTTVTTGGHGGRGSSRVLQ